MANTPRPRGAIRSPAHKAYAAHPHRAVPAPASYFHLAPHLEYWGNDRYGDCVPAESMAAKAADGIPATDEEGVAWARDHRWLNGATLTDVMETAADAGIPIASKNYKDGPYHSVDWTDWATLTSAIAAGQVKLAVAADQLEGIATDKNGWFLYTARIDSHIDHCVGAAGYGTLADCCDALGVPVPPDHDPQTLSVIVFTWATYGIVSHAALVQITGEAWLRVPTTIAPTPQPQPQPQPKPDPQPWCNRRAKLAATHLIRAIEAFLSCLFLIAIANANTPTPTGTADRVVSIYYAPDPVHLPGVAIALAGSATTSLKLATWNLRDTTLGTALSAAAARGVRVQAALNLSGGSQTIQHQLARALTSSGGTVWDCGGTRTIGSSLLTADGDYTCLGPYYYSPSAVQTGAYLLSVSGTHSASLAEARFTALISGGTLAAPLLQKRDGTFRRDFKLFLPIGKNDRNSKCPGGCTIATPTASPITSCPCLRPKIPPLPQTTAMAPPAGAPAAPQALPPGPRHRITHRYLLRRFFLRRQWR